MKNIIKDAQLALRKKKEKVQHEYVDVMERETWGRLGEIFPDYCKSFERYSHFAVSIKGTDFYLVRRQYVEGLWLQLYKKNNFVSPGPFYNNDIQIKDLWVSLWRIFFNKQEWQNKLPQTNA